MISNGSIMHGLSYGIYEIIFDWILCFNWQADMINESLNYSNQVQHFVVFIGNRYPYELHKSINNIIIKYYELQESMRKSQHYIKLLFS